MGCDAGVADGGFGLLRIAWGVGMAAGAVLAESGSAGLSTGELRTVVASTPEGGGGVVDPVRRLTGRLGVTLEALAGLPEGSVSPAQLSRWCWFHACSVRLQDQIRRRVLEGETIPHEEKLFSLFEPHTRWIMKGKAGKPVELGVPLTVLEDQHPFILGWHLQWQGGDVDMAVPLVAACPAQYTELRGCSFDRGFHSPANQQQLAAMLEHVALPAKGRGTEASRARESEASFVARRRQHPGVESAIPCVGKPWLGPGAHTWPGRLRTHRGYLDPRRQPALARTVATATGGTAAPSHARTTLSSSGLAVPILNIHPSRPSGRMPHAPKASRRTSSALLEPRWTDDPSYIS